MLLPRAGLRLVLTKSHSPGQQRFWHYRKLAPSGRDVSGATEGKSPRAALLRAFLKVHSFGQGVLGVSCSRFSISNHYHRNCTFSCGAV